MILFIVLVAVIVSLLYFLITKNNDQWEKLGLPHDKPGFIVGNSPNLLTRKRYPGLDLQDVFDKYRGKFKICGFYNFIRPSVVVLCPTVVKRIMVTDFHKFSENNFILKVHKEIDPILAQNAFFTKGSDWKERRAENSPAFTASRLRALYPVIQNVCRDLVECVDKEMKMAGGKGIDARELCAKYTTDVSSNCFFALDSGELKNPGSEIRKMGKKVLAPGLRMTFLIIVTGIWPALAKYLKVAIIPKYVENFFRRIMQVAVTRRNASTTDHGDALQYYIDMQKRKDFSDRVLLGRGVTAYLEGVESPSIILSMLLLELAKDKRVQNKLRAEIAEAAERGPLTMDVVAELPYLNHVIHESMRLNPLGYMLQKVCTEDCELPLTEDEKETFKVTRNTNVIIPLLALNRDPRIFENPLQFYPERFEKDGNDLKTVMASGSFTSFGMGPRICLGMRFALTEMKAAVVDIIREYEVNVNPKMQLPVVYAKKGFFNLPEGGIWLDFKRL